MLEASGGGERRKLLLFELIFLGVFSSLSFFNFKLVSGGPSKHGLRFDNIGGGPSRDFLLTPRTGVGKLEAYDMSSLSELQAESGLGSTAGAGALEDI